MLTDSIPKTLSIIEGSQPTNPDGLHVVHTEQLGDGLYWRVYHHTPGVLSDEDRDRLRAAPLIQVFGGAQ